MIYALFGLPGSGKSYYAVNEFIVKRITTDTVISNIKLADSYEMPSNYIYLAKEDINNLNKNIESVMIQDELSHDDKKHRLEFLFSLYGKGNITLIVDECHLYGYRGRSSSNSWADDFLSIHRHCLGLSRKLDIVLITQVPSRLNNEIASQVEEAVKALPASQRIIKSFLEYKVFGSVDALKKNDKTMQLSSKIVKGDPQVFSLYESGYANAGNSGFRKKLIAIGVLLVVLIGFIIFRFVAMTDSGTYVGSIPKPDLIKKDENITKVVSVEENSTAYYKIYCTTSNELYKDYKSMKNFLYMIKDDDFYTYCYKYYNI